MSETKDNQDAGGRCAPPAGSAMAAADAYLKNCKEPMSRGDAASAIALVLVMCDEKLAAAWPDIGMDPLKHSDKVKGGVEGAKVRLMEALCVQQKKVPDQTALVWRTDIDRVLTELAIMTGRWNGRQETKPQKECDHDYQEMSDSSGEVDGGPGDHWTWRECRICKQMEPQNKELSGGEQSR